MINAFNCLSTVLFDIFYVVTVGKLLTHSLSRLIALITFHASKTTLIFSDITKAIRTGNKLDNNITAYVSQSSQIMSPKARRTLFPAFHFEMNHIVRICLFIYIF